MPARKITEHQFRARRKDRRMVWVDAAAFAVGLLVLTVSVGGIIVVDPEPEPIDWEYSWAQGKVTQKWCYGSIGFREGCVALNGVKTQLEQEPISLITDPVTIPNATMAIWKLSWVDDTPDTESADSEYYGKKFVYDENSTDLLRLEVTAPWGETFVAEGRNAADADMPLGEITIEMNITEPPPEGKMAAFDSRTVYDALKAQHTVEEHDALGEWEATVTVLYAGDQNGTLPTSACGDVPGPVQEGLPEEGASECNLHDEQNDLEDRGGVNPFFGVPGYRSSYEDIGNKWLLDFTVTTYQASVTF